MKHFLFPVLLAFAFLMGACSSDSSTPSNLIDYKVINRSELLDIKVSYDISVALIDNHFPTATELKLISQYLYGKEKSHERTFVTFYLPGMKVGAGAFATAHYDPNLEVKILEFMIPDQYKHLLQTTVPSSVTAKASKQLESLIKQREWDEVFKIVDPDKDTALRKQVYMVRDFLSSGDNCIKDPENLTCYESTVMKWKKLAIDLTQKSHFSNEFDRYLVDQTRVLKEGVKPIQRERWERKKQLESLIKQRQWDEVFKMIADKDATFYNRLYLTREFFDARDNCIKNPDIACYEETMTKWEELATNLNKWSPFSHKFSIYLNSLNDAFKAKIKPIYEAQIKKQEEARMKREKAREADLKTYRERANSDDAESRTEAFFHGEARALVILHVEPNKLRVGGREFRVKRNPVGKGCFVYDPRTRFYGVKRNLVWWIPKEDKAYPLNSPSKMVTPGLKWPREEGVDAPSTFEVIDYVFEGKPMRKKGSNLHS